MNQDNYLELDAFARVINIIHYTFSYILCKYR